MSNQTHTTNSEQSEEESDSAERRYAEQVQAFRAHAGVFVAGMVIIFMVNLLTNLAAGIAGEWSTWWSAWSLIGWGTGITIHGLVVRLNRPPSSTPTWEQPQIDKVQSR